MTDLPGGSFHAAAAAQTVRPGSALHRDALALLRGWPPPSPDQDRVRNYYLEHLESQPDGLRRDCVPDHITASTLIVSADHRRVLLTLHAKARAWFQMGGHCEDHDRTLLAAASREATEESGLPELVLDPVPVQLNTHEVPFCGTSGTVRHLDVRFLALAPASATHRTSAESLDVAWWPIDALPTTESNLLELVERARVRLTALDS
ncbi:MAG: NUDIX domain-containing protein [Actinomycetota bacterium]|nr:NUDIX domain-containing protein [Actinomycetota bacterium]